MWYQWGKVWIMAIKKLWNDLWNNIINTINFDKDNFFQEQYIFKTKSSKNLQSLLYRSALNICQDQCCIVEKTRFLYFSLPFCFFLAIKNRIWFLICESIQNCQEHFFLQNCKVLIPFIIWSGFGHSNQHFKIIRWH